MTWVRVRHRCDLPAVLGHGDIWRCDECGTYWRSKAPGNPKYEVWVRLGWLGRLMWIRNEGLYRPIPGDDDIPPE